MTKLLASQDAPWSFRTLGSEGCQGSLVTGFHLQPVSTAENLPVPSLPGGHLASTTSRSLWGQGWPPCSRQLQLQTCVCLLGYPRALSSCLESHRKNSHGTTLQTLKMTPRLSRVAFLSLWRLWASLKGLRHPSTPQLRGPLLPATPESRGPSSSPPCTQSILADLTPFLSPPAPCSARSAGEAGGLPRAPAPRIGNISLLGGGGLQTASFVG